MASSLSGGRPTLLTVGMPVYNGESFLPQAIESILTQSFEAFRLIISDNGSTDQTPEICKKYARQDSRVHYLRSPQNRGATWNYNQVFLQAQSKYFKWASHDDICAPLFFDACITNLEKHPDVILCYPQTVIINESGMLVKTYPDELDLRSDKPHVRFQQYLHIYRSPHMCNPIFGVIRSTCLNATRLIGSYVSTDMVLLGELSLQGKFYEIPEPLFYRRDHPQASVRRYPKYRERIAWFDPAKKGSLQLTRWRWFREYLSAIRRAPIPASEKMLCFSLMAQWCGWNARGLVKDLVKAAAWPILQRSLQTEGEPV